MTDLQQRILDYPDNRWFEVADLTNGVQDTECWLSLCNAAMAHLVRAHDNALLICNETRTRFCWLRRFNALIALEANAT